MIEPRNDCTNCGCLRSFHQMNSQSLYRPLEFSSMNSQLLYRPPVLRSLLFHTCFICHGYGNTLFGEYFTECREFVKSGDDGTKK
ncbi:hypothetical protein H5410_061284 [Solanum commersonii]|uniref:Uncharacterized protein n=1 Tax=Solanum commersonii TaxID=4109 RepID=A0A9J5W962_SOLCO|nr:hypothetical protein H5410_061284 [Solanum commersonii]